MNKKFELQLRSLSWSLKQIKSNDKCVCIRCVNKYYKILNINNLEKNTKFQKGMYDVLNVKLKLVNYTYLFLK